MCDVLVDFTHNDLNVGHHLDSDCMEMVTDISNAKVMCVKLTKTSQVTIRREKHACL